mmetsp:Transcript_20194/g.48096  ORF Transcript_20194/g.48096 Transcript_20194/m.48096 type:complete len:82 (-) Transcript_20194:107-352(-)
MNEVQSVRVGRNVKQTPVVFVVGFVHSDVSTSVVVFGCDVTLITSNLSYFPAISFFVFRVQNEAKCCVKPVVFREGTIMRH